MKVTLAVAALFLISLAISHGLERLRQHYRRHPRQAGFYEQPDQVPDGWTAIVQTTCPTHGYAPHEAPSDGALVCILCGPLTPPVAVKGA